MTEASSMHTGQHLTRHDVVVAARAWLGTPYHHQASRRSIGTDCVGLVRGVWQDLYGKEAESAGAYTRDWAEATGQETLLAAARRHLIEIDPAIIQPGDVAVFRYRTRMLAKHTGIIASSLWPRADACGTPRDVDRGSLTLIHATEGTPACEVALLPWWRRRIAAAFAFPGLID
ncbi:MAG: peptidase P60 [Hyphomicrobiaceae bacterium]